MAAALALSACAAPERPAPVAALVEDLDEHWEAALPGELAGGPDVVLLSGAADTACGTVQEEDGSFFCGEDSTIYLQQLDLDDTLGQDPEHRSAAQAYLLAHEYGHYVQDQLGLDTGQADRGPDSASVRYELQADCLAGAFVAGQAGLALPTLLEVVRASGDDVGDDPLPPQQYEHGTGEQRAAAFERGRAGGAPACLAP